MDFVGGGDNIAITTVHHFIIFLCCVVNIQAVYGIDWDNIAITTAFRPSFFLCCVVNIQAVYGIYLSNFLSLPEASVSE